MHSPALRTYNQVRTAQKEGAENNKITKMWGGGGSPSPEEALETDVLLGLCLVLTLVCDPAALVSLVMQQHITPSNSKSDLMKT